MDEIEKPKRIQRCARVASCTQGWRRAKAFWALAVLSVAALASACAKPYDPFRIPAAELRGRVQTIALAPLRTSSDLADASFARARIEPLVAARLAAEGFQVLEAHEMERLWRSAAADVGDLFDPVTGELDGERFEAVEAAVYRDLRSKHGVDAVLYTRVTAVELYLTGAKVTFCGSTGTAYWPGEKIGAFERTTMVRAICLNVGLYDMEERELYGIRSGLEIIETFARQTRAARPRPERLQDEERLKEAVERTVGPLAQAAGVR